METYYFEEKEEFILLCQIENYKFIMKRYNIISNSLNYINSLEFSVQGCSKLKEFSLIYNKTSEDYNLISDCNLIEDQKYCFIEENTENMINSENNFIDFKTSEEKPSKDKPSEEGSGEDESSEEKSSEDKPSEENPNEDKPSEEKPSEVLPSEKREENINKIEEDSTEIIINEKHFSITDKPIYIIERDSLNEYLNQLIKENNDTNIEFFVSIQNLLSQTDKELVLLLGDKTVTITPSNVSSPNNVTHANSSSCEEKLKKHYNITEVTRQQIEINNNDPNALTNQVELAFYYKNKKLNSSICENVTIFMKIKENTTLDINELLDYGKKNIDILNAKDDFFNDICYPYSENGDDIIIGDRRKDIYKNFSLCQEGCTYQGIDYENLLVACNCKISENISLEIRPLSYEDFEDVSFFDSNIDIFQCYNLVFSFENKKDNIGFWVFNILLISYIVSICFYFFKGIKPTMNYVFNEMVKYGYLNKSHEMFFEKKPKKNIIQTEKGKKKQRKKTSNPLKKTTLKFKKVNKINNTINVNIMLKNSKKRKRKIYYQTTKGDHSKAKLDTKIDTKDNKGEKYEEGNDLNFGLIKKSINHNDKYISHESNQTLHNYTFKEAVKYDQRSLFRIYYIYLLSKQIIFHTFFQKSPLELFPLRICHLIFMISTDLSLNALLFLKDNISKKYRYTKSLFLFAFSDNITVIIYSTLLCFVLMTLLSKLSSSTSGIRKIFTKEEEKIEKKKKYKIDEKRKKEIFYEVEGVLKKLKIKIIILISIQMILMLLFWYYTTAFCHVYKSTQKIWLWDSFLSIVSRMIIELLFAILFAKLYLISIQSSVYCIYRIVLFIYDFS